MADKKSPQTQIHLAADHGGFELKEAVKQWLIAGGFDVIDHGTNQPDPLDDFPDFISLAAAAISAAPNDRGLVFGGSGQGEAMLANRFPNVRATVYYGGDEKITTLSRAHNDANILSIGARFVEENHAKKVIWDWLHASGPEDEKYLRRNKKIERLAKYIDHDSNCTCIDS